MLRCYCIKQQSVWRTTDYHRFDDIDWIEQRLGRPTIEAASIDSLDSRSAYADCRASRQVALVCLLSGQRRPGYSARHHRPNPAAAPRIARLHLSSSVIGVLRPQPRQSMLSAPMLHKRRRPTHPPSKAQVWRIGQPGLSVTVPIGSLAARILGTDMVRRPPGDGRAEGSVPLFPHTPTGRADGLRSS